MLNHVELSDLGLESGMICDSSHPESCLTLDGVHRCFKNFAPLPSSILFDCLLFQLLDEGLSN